MKISIKLNQVLLKWNENGHFQKLYNLSTSEYIECFSGFLYDIILLSLIFYD